jgi:hypothetical protein
VVGVRTERVDGTNYRYCNECGDLLMREKANSFEPPDPPDL